MQSYPQGYNHVVNPTSLIPSAILNRVSAICSTGNLDLVRRTDADESWPVAALSGGIIAAALRGNAPVARYLFNRGAKLNHGMHVSIGVQSGSPAFMNLMVEHGWDVQAEGKISMHHSGYISWALKSEAGVRWLLQHGAPIPRHRISPREHTNGWLLNGAAKEASVTTFKLLRSLGAPLGFPLHAAAAASSWRADRIPMMEYCVDDLGIDVNDPVDVGDGEPWVEISEKDRRRGPHGHKGPPLYHAIAFWDEIDKQNPRRDNSNEIEWLIRRGAGFLTSFESRPSILMVALDTPLDTPITLPLLRVLKRWLPGGKNSPYWGQVEDAIHTEELRARGDIMDWEKTTS